MMSTKEKIVSIPKGVTPISSRVAASMLQCSMGHIRWLRAKGHLRSWKIGSRYAMLDRDEVTAMAKRNQALAKKGSKVGAPAGGFKPDT